MNLKLIDPKNAWIKNKLMQVHETESLISKEISQIDYDMKMLQKKKTKLAKRMADNIKYRNKLVNQIS